FSERDQLVLKSLAQQAVALMELRRLNANANEYRRQLSTVEKMHAVGELAAAVAHEINNPLLVLRANAERLLEDATAMKEARPTVEKAANSMLRMSDRIGKITQTLREHLYDGAKEDLDFCSLGEIVNSALEVCGDRFVTEKIRLISDFDDTFFFTCRSTVVSQILVNLLTNAMDAVSQLDQKWIDLTVKVENGYVIFRITDSGAITDDQIRSKLMTPFFTTKIRGKGLGLGLNLSRRLAESSGGALMLDKASENTSFVLHLPLRCTLS
ncbi:MAG: ATP-binding protein, partial [Bdellovibrionota bacterium]